ncbi:uncharacterized protein CIMG_11805 [Coccidioides immitis RS]|uniref:Uncharacterized protein n=1 Tax=Coccidioides immitis (strain RS) TaxID=246410 RepID=A0A0D8JU28_COCIM|nr:uncharacterized protein CIMG_11805 [Coccidioides immitis RS]KJF60614.1 hypothetical protein CIMG_11805 [Coccidioides immitis RS]
MNCECPLNRLSSLSLALAKLSNWSNLSPQKRPGKPGSHDPELKETALRIPGTQDDKQEVSICRILGSLSGLNDLLLLSEINSLISAGHGSRQRKTKRQNALIHAVIDESLVRGTGEDQCTSEYGGIMIAVGYQ